MLRDRLGIVFCYLLCSVLLLALAVPSTACGQDANSWTVERLRLKNGNVVEGLITSVNEDAIEVVELRRPPGRRMFLVARPIARFDVAQIERLDDAQRKVLEGKIQKFRSRTRVEQGRMDAVELAPLELSNSKILRYEGDWFRLDSDLDPEMTRLCIVRLEQMFLAFRQVLPVRHLPRIDNWLKVRIYGSTHTYFDTLRTRGVEIRNLAYYDPVENLVVAGGDTGQFGVELAQCRQEHAKILDQYDRWNTGLPGRLKQLEGELEQNGVARSERARILAAARNRWEKELVELRNQIRLLDRKNDSLMSGLVDKMLRSLYHEAFHAYLEDYVFRRSVAEVPNWLNEGLAQIFEAGLLDAGTLRIDSPDAEKLKPLKNDLAGEDPLSLSQLLKTDGQAFLVHRTGPVEEAQRRYLYSWGLAYYLTFERGLLDDERLEHFVLKEQIAPGNSTVEQFEKLVGQPLAEFEQQWRAFIREL